MPFLFLFTIVNGQSKIDGYSLNPKLAYYNWTEDDGGFMGGAELNVLRNKFIYSLDYYRYEEFVLFSPDPSVYYNQIGLMIGKYVGDKLFRFQYQGGIAPFWGIKRTELIKEGSGIFSSDYYDKENFFTMGLTIKLGFKIVPSQFLSIGIDLQTNLNPERPVYMPMISIEIGKLRNKID
jgi:hypothetical protein